MRESTLLDVARFGATSPSALSVGSTTKLVRIISFNIQALFNYGASHTDTFIKTL